MPHCQLTCSRASYAKRHLIAYLGETPRNVFLQRATWFVYDTIDYCQTGFAGGRFYTRLYGPRSFAKRPSIPEPISRRSEI
jgi:hypothetical protein